jgi:hypothetical protein
VIIWGTSRYIQQLAMLTFLCGNCGNPAAHPLKRAVTKFTLFFIPLFPISTRYFTQCTFCGCTRTVPKEEARRLLPQGQPAPQGGQPAPGQGQPAHPGVPPNGQQPVYPQPGGYPQPVQYPPPGQYPQYPQYPQGVYPPPGWRPHQGG